MLCWQKSLQILGVLLHDWHNILTNQWKQCFSSPSGFRPSLGDMCCTSEGLVTEGPSLQTRWRRQSPWGSECYKASPGNRSSVLEWEAGWWRWGTGPPVLVTGRGLWGIFDSRSHDANSPKVRWESCDHWVHQGKDCSYVWLHWWYSLPGGDGWV